MRLVTPEASLSGSPNAIQEGIGPDTDIMLCLSMSWASDAPKRNTKHSPVQQNTWPGKVPLWLPASTSWCIWNTEIVRQSEHTLRCSWEHRDRKGARWVCLWENARLCMGLGGYKPFVAVNFLSVRGRAFGCSVFRHLTAQMSSPRRG